MSINVQAFDATSEQEFRDFQGTIREVIQAVEVPAESAPTTDHRSDAGMDEPASGAMVESRPAHAENDEPSLSEFAIYRHLVDLRLTPPSLDEAVGEILKDGFYRREEIEEAIVSLTLGHVMLAGPPGTGKTSLARSLAKAFGVELHEATANPEWSVYDVIGSQTLRGGKIVERPGAVTRAVLAFHATMHRREDNHEDVPQAVWLLIDEVNRAEIDRAFGSLFTALGGGKDRLFSLDFLTPQRTIPIPSRFRIIGALNSFDTSFVNTMSAALRRRFARVLILPPDNVGGLIPEAEYEIAMAKALAIAPNSRNTLTSQEAGERVAQYRDLFRHVFGFFRQPADGRGLMVGTAQAIDVLAYMATRVALSHTTLDEGQARILLDEAIVTRLSSSLESDHTRAILESGNFLELFKSSFPWLKRTYARLVEV